MFCVLSTVTRAQNASGTVLIGVAEARETHHQRETPRQLKNSQRIRVRFRRVCCSPWGHKRLGYDLQHLRNSK